MFAMRCASGIFEGVDERCAVLTGFSCLPDAVAAALAGCTVTFSGQVFGMPASGALEKTIDVTKLAFLDNCR